MLQQLNTMRYKINLNLGMPYSNIFMTSKAKILDEVNKIKVILLHLKTFIAETDFLVHNTMNYYPDEP